MAPSLQFGLQKEGNIKEGGLFLAEDSEGKQTNK